MFVEEDLDIVLPFVFHTLHGSSRIDSRCSFFRGFAV